MHRPRSDDTPLPDLLMRAARTLRHRWGGVLEPWGLSPHQARALGALGTDDLRISDVAAALRIAPRSATEVVDGLEEKALVERAADPADRRVVVVRLTAQGREVRTAVEQARHAGAEELLARLDQADRLELARLLRRLVDEAPAGQPPLDDVPR